MDPLGPEVAAEREVEEGGVAAGGHCAEADGTWERCLQVIVTNIVIAALENTYA